MRSGTRSRWRRGRAAGARPACRRRWSGRPRRRADRPAGRRGGPGAPARPRRWRARRRAGRRRAGRGSRDWRRRRPWPGRSPWRARSKSTPGGSGVCRMMPCTVGSAAERGQLGAESVGVASVARSTTSQRMPRCRGPGDGADVPGRGLVRRREDDGQPGRASRRGQLRGGGGDLARGSRRPAPCRSAVGRGRRGGLSPLIARAPPGPRR